MENLAGISGPQAFYLDQKDPQIKFPNCLLVFNMFIQWERIQIMQPE